MKYDAYGNENGEQDNDGNSNLAPQLNTFVLVRFPPQRRQRTDKWLSFEISQRKKTWALDCKELTLSLCMDSVQNKVPQGQYTAGVDLVAEYSC